jgi:nitrous oxide reductase accessory protein NosL
MKTIRPTALAAALIALLCLPACAPQESAPSGDAAAPAATASSGEEHESCTNCGMDATASKGRFVLDFEDGTTVQACSGQCALTLKKKLEEPIYKVQVFGYDSGELIDGEGAIYVLGCDTIPEGSMGPPVFAFASKEAAEAFVADHGGHACDLDEVLGETEPHGS